MALEPIPFNGMASLEADELIGIGQALVAENCILDDDTIRTRNGYRAATAAALTGSGSPQMLTRFRPTPTSARTIAGISGALYSVTDPTLETASDGVSALLGTPFGASAHLSATQLGRYLYLATDESAVPWNRLDSSYSLVGLGSLPQAAIPSYSLSSLAIVKFNTLTGTYTSATNSTLDTDWIQVVPTATGGGVEFNLGTDKDWTSYNWLLLFVTPNTQSNGSGTLAISISTSGGTYEKVGEILDGPGNGAPSCVFCPINGLSAATRSAARKIQIINTTNNKHFAVHGYMAIPSAPTTSPSIYNVTFFNSTTSQESPLSPDLSITYSSAFTAPFYHSVYADHAGFTDEGGLTTDPSIIPPQRCYNKSNGRAMPQRSEFASIPSFSGPIPAADQNPKADMVRLWRVTETGRRLVKAVAISFGQTTYSVTDDQGDATLTHQLYKAQGTPPRVTALTSRAQRLIGAYENRIYISSFVPTAASNDPYPQFPDIPIDDSDGWSFDISPANNEQVQFLCNGDALYILSNEAAYVMTNLEPNSPPFKVFERGTLGRRSACWAEERLFYAAHDGIYAIANRAGVTELSQAIRRMYKTWFRPDSTTVVSYQNRKLWIWCGGRYLRYDFVKSRWTRGTTAATFQHAAAWRDPSGTVQNMWFLASDRNVHRWQPSDVVGASAALTDNGAAIPCWVYATGFDFTPTKARIRKFWLDTTGPAVQISVHTSMEDLDGKVKESRRTDHEIPWYADQTAYELRIKLTGIGGAQLRRLLWERMPVSGEGA